MPSSLYQIAHRHRRLVASFVYAAIALAGLGLAYLASFELHSRVLFTSDFVALSVLLVAIRLGVNYLGRLGISRWRFVGTSDFVRLLVVETAGSTVFFLITWVVPGMPNVPRSIVLLEWVFNGYLTGGTWLAYRLLYEITRGPSGAEVRRVLVVGAGEAGQLLVREMLRGGAGLKPVGFVDDDPFKWGMLIHGVEVIGSTEDAASIASALHADEILIALPSATSEQLRRVIESCEVAALPMKILPGIQDVIKGGADLSMIRDVEVEDLLGREPIQLELPELEEELGGRCIFVTGAAGSIGSELVAQIALHRPECLVLLDQAETPLYYLELEIRSRFPDLCLEVIVGSVTDRDLLSAIMSRHRPEAVFHAAAYKHVPMMEGNAREAIRTNVLGTWNVASTAAAGGARKLVLISTDKAVRPSSVMGASKQLAERACLHLQSEFPLVEFRAVRFGNVLGSNGSVIPLFRRQLKEGKPLTVTHEDVTRFFMTIPEAVQLVLQASTLAESWGRVSMLDMGAPMRILDLARNMLRLSGQPFRPGQNVVISGLRPGEKLHEELNAPEETVWRTSVERVSIVETAPGFSQLPEDVVSALDREDLAGLVEYFCTAFPELTSGEAPVLVAAGS
jgi:FlaA1/EpsC-like NDP-sugar epimerase